jgi:hypothetical protein
MQPANEARTAAHEPHATLRLAELALFLDVDGSIAPVASGSPSGFRMSRSRACG